MPQGRTFKFRLEAVGNYRKRILDMREQALAKAYRVVSAARERREHLCGTRVACREAISAADPDGRLDANDLRDMDARISYLGGAIRRQCGVVAHHETEAEDRRLEVVDASKRKEVVERLRERHYAKFMGELAIEDRKFLDEVGSVRSARSRNANVDTGPGIQRVT